MDDLDKAEKLARESEYAFLAAEQETNPINFADAAQFVLIGNIHATKIAAQNTFKIYQLADQLQSLVEHAWKYGTADKRHDVSWKDSNTRSVLNSIIDERNKKGLVNNYDS